VSRTSSSARRARNAPATTAAVPRRPEQAVPYLLRNLHHSLRQAVDESFRRDGLELSFAHFATLYTLANEPGVAGAEIARRLFVTAQTMNAILRRMEEEGVVERRPHPGNARADSWYLTRAGEARFARAKKLGDAVWRRMLSTLAPQEVDQLQDLLRRCISAVDSQLESLRTPARKKSRRSATTARSRRIARD